MTEEVDVLVVGAGPVGLATAGFLGRRGWKVLVCDLEASRYPLPRAGHVDSEIVRLLQQLGTADGFVRKAVPLKEAEFWDKDGELLTKLPLLTDVPSGWFSDYLMYQPDFDDAIHRALQGLPNVEVRRSAQVVGLDDTGDAVEVTIATAVEDAPEELSRVTTRNVIGADGANSFVRRTLGATLHDLGFHERWLVVDLEPHDPAAMLALPTDAQLCDPDQPTSLFRWLGRKHLRLEFMLNGAEDSRDAASKDGCWTRLAMWGISAENCNFTRRAVYTFQSQIADNWRAGRIFIAGDAAHLMPPFLGQGMCSGIRDAANLAWKLDLILRGLAHDALLDTYQEERSPHVEVMIGASIDAGKLVCITDPAAAAARDAELRQLANPPIATPPPLEGGLQASAVLHPADGSLSPQGRIVWSGAEGLLEDLVIPGWKLITDDLDAAKLVPEDLRGVIDQTVQVTQGELHREGVAIDLDAVYSDWLARAGARYVLVRPDLYVYRAAKSREQLTGAFSLLRAQLGCELSRPNGD